MPPSVSNEDIAIIRRNKGVMAQIWACFKDLVEKNLLDIFIDSLTAN